jgi:lactoylglutathione lyase
MMIDRLDHVAISVADLQRSIDFYSRNFGLEAYFQHDVQSDPPRTIAYLRSPQGILELMHAPGRSMGQGFHFCFVTDDFDAAYARLVRDGVPVKSEPRPTAARDQSEEGWLRCVFSGPDGEEIEVRGPGQAATYSR